LRYQTNSISANRKQRRQDTQKHSKDLRSSYWCGLKGEERREVAKEYSLAVATVAAGRAAAAFGSLSSVHHYMLPKHTHLENLA
jgi:hypothetical protein